MTGSLSEPISILGDAFCVCIGHVPASTTPNYLFVLDDQIWLCEQGNFTSMMDTED